MTEGSEIKPNVLAVDIDGVLVHPDSRFGEAHWDRDLQADLAIDPKELGKRFYKVYWADVTVGKLDLREALVDVLRGLNPDVSVDEFLQYWFTNDANLDLDVASEIEAWNRDLGYTTLALTNQEKYRLQHLTEVVGIGRLFDHIIWSGEVGLTKSSPEFYSVALQRVPGSEPQRCWFFDDDQRNVDVATSLGWNAHLFTDVNSMRDILVRERPAD